MQQVIFFLIFVLVFVIAQAKYECQHRSFGFGSTVCVCNKTFCGSTVEIRKPSPDAFQWYVSNKAGKRLELSIRMINDSQELSGTTQLYLNRSRRYQKIHGWGGSFTDSSFVNVRLLSPGTQRKLMQSYFGSAGSRYNLARVPIGATDFSIRRYTYDDTAGDVELKNFALQSEDLELKIPAMQEALAMNPELKFVTAAWSAPEWMKIKKDPSTFGFLRYEYYQTFADYVIKFLDEYKKRGITFRSVSTGNEPALFLKEPVDLGMMNWTPRTTAKWVAENLGPALDRSQHNETEIYTFDDRRSRLPTYVAMIFENKKAEKYVKSIGVHWYQDNEISPTVLDRTHKLFPDKPIIMTEACVGYIAGDVPKVKLGSWKRAEYYIFKMIENLNHWVAGWIDWNLVLNKIGGPNIVNNHVDAPIIVNPDTDEFFKQPLYYSIKHFSRFVPRDSVRLDITNTPQVAATAFETPENNIVVVLCNMQDDPENVSIDDSSSNVIAVTLSPRSLNTIIYRRRTDEK